MRDSLDTAKAMAAAGKTSEEIRAITGWFPGKYDGKMRFEVPDEGATWNRELDWNEAGKSSSKPSFYGAFSNLRGDDLSIRTLPLSSVLNHPALYEAYPDLKDVAVQTINIKPSKAAWGPAGITIDVDASPKEALSSMLHEIQHWIQEKEGFEKGSSPDAASKRYDFGLLEAENGKYAKAMRDLVDSYRARGGTASDAMRSDQGKVLGASLNLLQESINKSVADYRRTAGEIESRDVQARKDFTPEQRKAIAPYSSENIATEDAILLSGKGGQARFQPADADYLAAVKSGDMKVVQGMVDEAAKAAGYTFGPVSHTSSHSDFDKFITPTWFEDSEASTYKDAYEDQGGITRRFYLRLQNPKKLTWDELSEIPYDLFGDTTKWDASLGDSKPWVDKKETDWPEFSKDERKAFFKNNHDGFISEDGDISAVVYAHQIKSADPITRDSQGNVIPLSQRFNTKSEDIRYQPADGADVVRLADPEDSTAFANVPALKKNGKPALDPAGKPKTKKIAYGLLTGMEKHSGVAVDPSHPDYKSLAYDVPVVAQQLINAAIDNGGVDKLAGELVAKTQESLKNPEIAGGMGWYSRMRGHLLRALDEEGREIFSQLLGATSAKTPVEQNFLQAVDAHEGMRSGRYEGVKAKHLEMMDAERAGTLNALIEERGYVKKIGEMERAMSKELRFLKGADRDRVKLDIKSIKRLLNLAPDEREKKHRIAIMKFAEDIVPRRSNGRKFNSNSGAVLKVLIGTWIQNREAPKTPNFAGNLSGRTIAATIDVWAARHLRELIHGNTDGPWRIQPKSEGAVSNADFALGQVIMERAAKQLGMNPDDLQAVLWFAEKDHWDKQGWTSKDGASKSSFDDVFHIFFPEGKDPLTFAEGERKVKELRERLKLSEAEELIDAESDSD